MKHNGHIQKMHTALNGECATYKLSIGDSIMEMNSLIERQISLKFNGKITCSNCKAITKKSYSQGFCFSCCRNLARCDLCIMKPETCHHHFGTCREPLWGLDYCFVPHIIYLANSSGIKVGITRKNNIPSRWIDQGAIQALPIIEVDTRLKSGQIEMALKEHVNDRTNWQKMLKNETKTIDLEAVRDDLFAKIKNLITELEAKILINDSFTIQYPVAKYPSKINSLNFDKTPEITGVLQGIKGQYLLLDCGVLNIRKFNSYNVSIEY